MFILKLTIKSLKKFQINFLLKNNSIIKKKLISQNINRKKKRKLITVLKSPHVHKKSREQFNFEFFKQTIFIKNQNFFILLDILIYLKTIIQDDVILQSKIIKVN